MTQGADRPEAVSGSDRDGRDDDGPPIEVLEFDENVPPRPEEDVADAGRARPDPH